MPICISCRFPIPVLYTTYSKADDRALGKGVRLTQCPNCKGFADKYVEHDFVVLFIDLVLIKPEVYRHLLHNRIPTSAPHLDRSMIRLGILLLLFDVYLTWARIEKIGANALLLARYSLGTQYLFFLALVAASTLAFHVPITALCRVPGSRVPVVCGMRTLWNRAVAYYPYPTPLSTALLVSSCTKLFPILLIIWDYDLPSSATAVSWAVIVNNVAALEILMDCGYVRAGVLVGVGAGVRSVVSWGMLRMGGLETGWEGYSVMQEVGRWCVEVRSLA
ncbi:Arv1-like family-domain-containing protein [Ampelomyces quisqualis]|uniref:Protein ARV n=1 Tax=Ampelomyces quisqualis TaxID=50730 RepID=A0A6A5QE97_AMPQU|nr:Arv1-like family-domain-containing protein [Ampelomyces quisqualis]